MVSKGDNNNLRIILLILFLFAVTSSLSSAPVNALCGPVDACCADDPTCPAGNNNCQGQCPSGNCLPDGINSCRGPGGACKDVMECQGSWCSPEGYDCNWGPNGCCGSLVCNGNGVCAPNNPCDGYFCPTGNQQYQCKPSDFYCQIAHKYYTGACTGPPGGEPTCEWNWVQDENCCTDPPSNVCSGSWSCTRECVNAQCVPWNGAPPSGSCEDCGGTSYVCSGQTIIRNDGFCNGNGNCGNTPTTVDNCDAPPGAADGWFNVGGPYPCCVLGNSTTCQDEQFRDYSCVSGNGVCQFAVTQTRTTSPPGTACPTSEDTCAANLTTLRDYTGGSCQGAGVCQNPFIDRHCAFGCQPLPGNDACNQNPPPVVQPITYSGTCNSGQTITLNCVASDPNQQANTLTVRAWAGECTLPSCFDTRSWIYFANSSMTAPPSGGTFTKTLSLTSPPGTAIPATCLATDSFGAISNWGDMYPLCTTNSCGSPPAFSNFNVVPNPTKAGSITITFTVSRALQANPTVNIRNTTSVPGGFVGFNFNATFVSLNGLTYTYSATINQTYYNGLASITAFGLGQSDACYGSGASSVSIDTVKPASSVLCNGAACQSSYLLDSPINVTFSCNDAAPASGCASIHYSWNGGPDTVYGGAPVQVSSSGNHTFVYYSIDNAGNVESPSKTVTFEFYSQIGCGGVICVAPADVCMDPQTLRQYTSSICLEGTCVNSYNDIVCPNGCLELPGQPDVCASDPRPLLNDLTLRTSFTPYARLGDMITMDSIAHDVGGQNIQLICGTTPGGSDLCTSALVALNPSCSFASPWPDTTAHDVECFVEDEGGTTSENVIGRTVLADNTPPDVFLTKVPDNSTITPGTQVFLIVFAGDEDSDISNIKIYVNNQLKETCGGGFCNYTFTPTSGLYNFTAIATDNVNNANNAAAATDVFAVTTPPSIDPRAYYTGNCITGGTINLYCNATDAEDPSSALSLRANAGDCTAANCLNTVTWNYLNNVSMSFVSGKTFTRSFVITSASGTGIAASCRAWDTTGTINQPIYQGDALPVCIVNGCTNPPVVTVNSVMPNVVRLNQRVNITFTVDRALSGQPTVFVMPFGQSELAAQFVSQNGLTYVYNYTVTSANADGAARVRIHVVAPPSSCPQDERASFVIDKTTPTTTVICNGQSCSAAKVYRTPVLLGFNCDDASGCRETFYGINAPATLAYSPLQPPIISDTGVYSVNYQSVDGVGNVGFGSQLVRTYNSSLDEEAVIVADFDKDNVILGSPLNGFIYCFLRDVNNPEVKTRDCDLDPLTLSITVDPGTPGEKDYFVENKPPISPADFVNDYKINTPTELVVDGYYYQLNQYWKYPINTDIFQSTFCIDASDNLSGYGGSDCDSYSTSGSEIRAEISFPDVVAGTVPLTAEGAPNFTKLMPVKFNVEALLVGTYSSSECKSANCRVEFNFVPVDEWDFNPPRIADWSGFEDAYTPDLIEVSSSEFQCNQFMTLYIRATKQAPPDSGISTTNQTDFFINCETKLTVVPLEKRLAVGEQPGNLFDVTLWNPTDDIKEFYIASTSTNPNGYPLSWIAFNCKGVTGCTLDPAGEGTDDVVGLLLERLSAKTVTVEMPLAVKSGAYPVTFVATDQADGSVFSAVGNILIFSEGLSEFSNVQLIGLIAIAVSVVVYYSLVIAKKPVPKVRSRKKKQ